MGDGSSAAEPMSWLLLYCTHIRIGRSQPGTPEPPGSWNQYFLLFNQRGSSALPRERYHGARTCGDVDMITQHASGSGPACALVHGVARR